MVQDLVGFSFLYVAVGCALSLVAAAFLSELSRNRTISGMLARLLLVSGPFYLAADYVIYQGVASTALTAMGFIFGLYCLRGWWAAEYFSLPVGFRVRTSVSALRIAMPQPTPVASDTLRYRVLGVVVADRQLQQEPRDDSLAKAA
jgi:hypothetical protein